VINAFPFDDSLMSVLIRTLGNIAQKPDLKLALATSEKYVLGADVIWLG
jgi:hypothetical protein